MRVSTTHASAALLLLIVAGCGSDAVKPDDPGDPVPASIAVHAGNQQQAAAGTAVPVAPAVIVRDAAGDPVAGVAVTFSVAAGGGTLVGATQATNSSGVAAVTSWVLGPSGTQRLTATATTLTPVEIQATVTPGTQQFKGTIGAGGGSFQIDDPGNPHHGLKLTAPSGMFPAATEWRMRAGNLSPRFSAPAGFTVIGPPIVVETAALRGDKLMTLEVPVPAGADDLVFLALHDPVSGASELLTTVERRDGAVVVATAHLRGDLLPGASSGGTLRMPSRSDDSPAHVVPMIMEELVGSIITELNRWPVVDIGTAANQDGVSGGIAAMEWVGSHPPVTSFAFVHPLSMTGMYSEPGPLAAVQLAEQVIGTVLEQAVADLGALLDHHPKAQRDRLMHENIIASMRFSDQPAMMAFTQSDGNNPSAALITSASPDGLTLEHPAMEQPIDVPMGIIGYAPFTFISGAPVPVNSSIADFGPIEEIVRELTRMMQGPEAREAANRALASRAGLPMPDIEFRNSLDDDWVRIQAQETAIVARKQSAEIRLVAREFSLHRLVDGTELIRSQGEPVPVVEGAALDEEPAGAKVLRPLSINVRGSDGILRQESVMLVEMAYDPFRITPDDVEIAEGRQDVEFTASVALPPAGGYLIEWSWGDGDTTEVVGSTTASHEYDSPASYEVIATLMAAGTRDRIAVDTAQVQGEGSVWIGSATVVAVSTVPGNLHTEYAEVTDIRFELDPEDQSSNPRYLAVSGVARMWVEAPCAGYVSPVVFANLADTPNQQWLRTRTTNPVSGGTPETGLWYTGNAYTPGPLKTKPCPTDFNPNPAEYTYTSGMVWLETYDDDLPETLWRAASSQNLIEGTMTKQVSPDYTYTWTWRFERAAAGQ